MLASRTPAMKSCSVTALSSNRRMPGKGEYSSPSLLFPHPRGEMPQYSLYFCSENFSSWAPVSPWHLEKWRTEAEDPMAVICSCHKPEVPKNSDAWGAVPAPGLINPSCSVQGLIASNQIYDLELSSELFMVYTFDRGSWLEFETLNSWCTAGT